MLPYFEYTEFDLSFYEKYLRSRIPSKIFDVHVHMNLPEHIEKVPAERWFSDWALECGRLLPCDDAYACAREIFPETEYSIAGFPWPIKEADIEGNNRYLAEMRKKGKCSPFMTVKPGWDQESIDKALTKGGFVGFKPYPDMVSGLKGADISIFSFLPHEQWEILNRHKKAVMLHLPRKGRFSDNDNVRELLEIRQKYPDITIIIAHFGRSFCPYYLKNGLSKMKGAEGFYFDTSAVLNPEVYDIAFSEISTDRILFGSDMPIPFFHGRRTWTEKDYKNLCREKYSWNKDGHEPPEIEKKYTLFIYEQMKSMLDAVERNGLNDNQKLGIFFKNAKKALKLRG